MTASILDRLTEGRMWGADLRDADLRNANLRNADLRGQDVDRLAVEGAIL